MYRGYSRVEAVSDGVSLSAVKRLAVALVLIAAAATLAAGPARAGECGLPETTPLWVDYAEASVGFRNEIFRRPGLVLASSGASVSEELRAGGAQTVYWHMKVTRLVGTP